MQSIGVFALGEIGVSSASVLRILCTLGVKGWEQEKEAALGRGSWTREADGVCQRKSSGAAALHFSLRGGVGSTLQGGMKLTGFGHSASTDTRDGKCSKEV